MERLRTRRRGSERLLQWLSELGQLERLGLLHTQASERVEALRRRVHHLVPGPDASLSLEVTPVIGVEPSLRTLSENWTCSPASHCPLPSPEPVTHTSSVVSWDT